MTTTKTIRILTGLGVLLAMAGTAAAQLNGPSSVTGGSTVDVTGTSASGSSGTTLMVEDDNGSIDFTVTWTGQSFRLTFRAPEYDPENPDNEIRVVMTPQPPNSPDSITIGINP